MSNAGEHAREIAHHVGEIAGDARNAVVTRVERSPRLSSAARAAAPFVRYAAYGAAFAGGAFLLTRLLGPSTARRLGNEGGQAFGEGGRGARFL